jgi:hypothetical protein
MTVRLVKAEAIGDVQVWLDDCDVVRVGVAPHGRNRSVVGFDREGALRLARAIREVVDASSTDEEEQS